MQRDLFSVRPGNPSGVGLPAAVLRVLHSGLRLRRAPCPEPPSLLHTHLPGKAASPDPVLPLSHSLTESRSALPILHPRFSFLDVI